MDGTTNAQAPLASDLETEVIKVARRDSVFAGLTSGLAGAIIGSKALGFGRNKTLFCGALTGVLSGYYFTQAFTSSSLARIRMERAKNTSADALPKPPSTF